MGKSHGARSKCKTFPLLFIFREIGFFFFSFSGSQTNDRNHVEFLRTLRRYQELYARDNDGVIANVLDSAFAKFY